MPKYHYWEKSARKPRSYGVRFVNREQRRLYFVMTAFNLAKVAAIVTMFLLIIGRV